MDNCLKLVTRQYKSENTIIKIGNVEIGTGDFNIFAGPCAVESIEQITITGRFLKHKGNFILRGCIFKPRTSPYAFQGLGTKGLGYLKQVKETIGIPIITEILDSKNLSSICAYVDVIQVGSRNMQNYSLLKDLARIKKPILLKRGMSATIEEWLFAAEYILSGGNQNVILCERGIRTFETYTRNTIDLTIIPIIKELTHLPIIIDPSHSTGNAKFVPLLSKAAFIMGADGLLIEIHPEPQKALCDGQQSLNFDQFNDLYSQIETLKKYNLEVNQF